MADPLEIVLLLALPASGKSEVRRYLAHLSPAECQRDFHLGATVQLDDFPYVHLMRRIDDELVRLGDHRRYFGAPDRPFLDGRDWGTLVQLLNQDYADLVARRHHATRSAAEHLFHRLDDASRAVGLPARMAALPHSTRTVVGAAIEAESRALLDEQNANRPALDGRTVVIEFARGGRDGSTQPLAAPFGYRYSLSQLAPAILERAAILYVWVTPEESRRKNQARTDPNDPGSILHHGVPMEVMLNDYGCDDMDWLARTSNVSDALTVEAHGRSFVLPLARFDNRIDKTSFLRHEEAAWQPDEVRAIHDGLQGALAKLAAHPARRAG